MDFVNLLGALIMATSSSNSALDKMALKDSFLRDAFGDECPGSLIFGECDDPVDTASIAAIRLINMAKNW